jgi:hypothetical protein
MSHQVTDVVVGLAGVQLPQAEHLEGHSHLVVVFDCWRNIQHTALHHTTNRRCSNEKACVIDALRHLAGGKMQMPFSAAAILYFTLGHSSVESNTPSLRIQPWSASPLGGPNVLGAFFAPWTGG